MNSPNNNNFYWTNIGINKNACPFYNTIPFFFQAEDGIRDSSVTGVQTCALPISEIKTDQNTALIALTHDPKIDDPALQDRKSVV